MRHLIVSLLLSVLSVGLAACASKPVRLLPKGSSPADIVDVVDISDCTEDTCLTALVLQGHANRGPHSKVYLLNDKPSDKHISDSFWLEYLKTKGYVKQTQFLTLEEYFSKYANLCEVVIVYDPKLPATINIATMMASVDKGMVVAPDDLEKYRSIGRIEDLRGRWQSNVQAYEWALKNLYPRMKHDVLASLHPSTHKIRDYMVRHQGFIFWVTGYQVHDGITSSFDNEKLFAEKLFRLSPPNTVVLGWWDAGSKDPGLGEYVGVGLAGQYGQLTNCVPGMTNTSFLSGIEVDLHALRTQYENRGVSVTPPLDPNKVYLSFVIVDSGDSSWYWQKVQPNVWDDPKRGEFPIGWALGPIGFEICAPIMAWYYENARPNDYFYLGLSGTCYVHPYRNFMQKLPNPDAAWKDYLKSTQYYIDALGFKEMSLYTDAWFYYDRSKMDPTTIRWANELRGINTFILGLGRDEGSFENGLHYQIGRRSVFCSHVTTRWNIHQIGRSAANVTWLIDDIKKHTPTERPA
ncbi:MAG: GxGYxYP family putative glycoside hydrolase, partial [Planctomycetota bacterium]|nr:GxGYxYP family putative glycoside hydrolase [Planctomycetota bacterium]